MVTKHSIRVLFILLLLYNQAVGQDIHFLSSQPENAFTRQTEQQDTIIPYPDESELKKIPDLRTLFEILNQAYTIPAKLRPGLRIAPKKEEIILSPEAQYWVNWKRDPETVFDEYVTFDDTIIVNPSFLPILFKGGLFPDDIDKMQLYDKNFIEKTTARYSIYKPDTALFAEEILRQEIARTAYDFVRTKHPETFRYSIWDLPGEAVTASFIKKTTYEPELIKKEANPTGFEDVDAPVKFIPERRYWISHFESSIHFAQNYISPNWHKGGISTLNLNNRQFFAYNYNREKVMWSNSLEWKANVYTAPKDTLRTYKIGDDVFRIYSNIGYKAFDKWYYTFDAHFQTQLFSNFQENSYKKRAALLSPLSINIGLGMQYSINKQNPQKRHRKFVLSTNIAPLSYTFMYSKDDSIDLARHGFKKKKNSDTYKNSLSLFGSTVSTTMNIQFSRNVTLYTRLYYFTNYDRILGELENRLTMNISRFFSTIISLNLRYDDAVAKKEEFDSHLQINELLSFGFNYKW